MKKYLFVLLLLFPFCASAQYGNSYSELFEGEVASRLRSTVKELSAASLKGRKAGSEGEAQAAAIMAREFQKLGINMLSPAAGQVFGISIDGSDTLVSRNIMAFIPGYDRKLRDHYIVIGARLDNLGAFKMNIEGTEVENIRYGANGNASGLAMMLELARKLKEASVLLKRSVIFAAFGSSAVNNAGSWYFLNRECDFTDKIDAMINLDMVGMPTRGFYSYTALNVDIDAVLDLVSETLQPMYPKYANLEPAPSDHRSFYAKSIPSVFFTTGMYPEYNTDKDTPEILDYDGMERELEYLYNFSIALVNGKKPSFSVSDDLKKEKIERNEDVVDFVDCDVPPIFMNNPDPRSFLQRWVYKYLRYPQDAVDQGIQGRVLLSFIVDETGKVKNVKVVRGVNSLLDEEAVRVVEVSPDWKPAKYKGKKVKSLVTIYVEFRLKERKK